LLASTTGYQTRAFDDAAKQLGIELVLATDRCHVLDDPWRDGAIPIRFHDEAGSVAQLVAAAAARSLDGILAVGDRPTVVAARVAQMLGLAAHTPEAAVIARDKGRARARLRAAGLPIPWFVESHVDADPRALASTVSFPCVIKPVALSASRGVMRADDPAGFCAAFDRLRALLRVPEIRAERNEAHDRIVVEGFIPGREFALEGLYTRGALKVLALFDKPDPLDGPFFEETIYLTPSVQPPEAQRAIADTVARAAEAIGLWHGPIHAECRRNDRGVFVLEVAARPIGGLCARALRFEKDGGGRSVSLEELLLRHALGEPPDAWSRETDAAGVMMIPIPRRGVYRGASGVTEARLVDGVEDIVVTAKIDQVLLPLPEGASYLGFIFARGSVAVEVERSLRAAHARLSFTIEPELPLTGPRVERPSEPAQSDRRGGDDLTGISRPADLR
jgi:biotin carboxylase